MTTKYSEDHEWISVDGDIGKVGITNHAQFLLGDIVFIELPDEGMSVTKGQEIVVIESVKAASDILAPLDGEIVEINNAIVDDPSMVNNDPTGEAWFFKMSLKNKEELKNKTKWQLINLVLPALLIIIFGISNIYLRKLKYEA